MVCFFCRREFQMEENGLICPFCHRKNSLSPEVASTLYHKAVTYEQDKRYDEAASIYRLLYEAGNNDGCEAYARCLEYGIGVKIDLHRALACYRQAAERGSAHASLRIARILSSTPSLSQRPISPLFWVRTAAAFGSAEGYYLLYREGGRLGLSEEERRFALTEAAHSGYRPALSRLASLYRKGAFGAIEPEIALWCYRQIPHAAPFFRLANRNLTPKKPPRFPLADHASYLLSLGEEAAEERVPTVSLRLFLMAVEEGSIEAATRAADCYLEGIGTTKSLEDAIRLYGMAERGGSAVAALQLGRLFEREKGERKAAEPHYRFAAEHGDGEYAYIAAEFYLSGEESDAVRRAMPYLRRAADNGILPAIDRLRTLESSINELYNRALDAQYAGEAQTAYALYEKAAMQGHADALCNLGTCRRRGLGCVANARTAARAYEEAVEAGSLAARLNLALCYKNGWGVHRDFQKARALLRDLPAPYEKDAEKLLLEMDGAKERKKARRLYAAASAVYRRGDVAGAIYLRLCAAKKNYAPAAYVIGCHFEFGDGVDVDREKANLWYDKAALGGFEGGRARLKGGFLREKRRLDSGR